MKEHFIRLFDYDRYANELILTTLAQAGWLEKPSELFAHLLATAQVWLNRCTRQPGPASPIWPDPRPGHFEELICNNHTAWINYLQRVSQTDFAETINYQNSKGERFSDTFLNIATHVINHGTHHRAQIGQLLKAGGIEKFPATDYIFYIRGHKSK